MLFPHKKNIFSVSDIDGVNTLFGYWGPFSYPMKARLYLALKCLNIKNKYQKLLDAGCGCGIFLPELSKHANDLYGIDIHDDNEQLYKMLKKENIDTNNIYLSKQSLESMNFKDDFFDGIVSISVLEHIKPNILPLVINEFYRILKKNGKLILGFPTRSIFIKVLAKLQKNDLYENHPSSENDILNAVSKKFNIIKLDKFPFFLSKHTCLHINIMCEKK